MLPLTAALCVSVSVLAGCISSTGEPEPQPEDKVVIEAREAEGIITFNELTASRVSGNYAYRGEIVEFDSEAHARSYVVTVALRSMVLTATVDSSGSFDLDGFNSADGTDTAMTEVDRALVHAFESALTDTYRARAAELPALDMFSRALSLWSDYPDRVPLRRTFFAREERRSGISLCDRVNKPGQGANFVPKWSWASHACLKIKGIFTTDCGPLTGGCAYGNDSSTVDSVFVSMHPGGGCDDHMFFGSSATNMRCYEPDHDNAAEFAYGDCFGRCGARCGGSSQFTQSCLDHDLCVAFGHWTYNPISACDDEFAESAVDYLTLSDCGGSFHVDYNLAGSDREGNCDPLWNYAGDGCDVGCQYVDGDCFR